MMLRVSAVTCADLNFDGTISPEEFAFTLMEVREFDSAVAGVSLSHTLPVYCM